MDDNISSSCRTLVSCVRNSDYTDNVLFHKDCAHILITYTGQLIIKKGGTGSALYIKDASLLKIPKFKYWNENKLSQISATL